MYYASTRRLTDLAHPLLPRETHRSRRATPSRPLTRLASISADMIIRLGRLTPGYFRLLQRQVAGEVQTQPQDRAINQIAMMLAIMGLSLSYYSAKQMTEKVQVQPAP
uniref:putative transmembrane protein ZNF593OS n=1 Tax=Scatophagus argus TaxID=75038 RepID=UPI001ED81DCD|nr:putative transmembrane protein ZNF593OS [Scatophagus argus]